MKADLTSLGTKYTGACKTLSSKLLVNKEDFSEQLQLVASVYGSDIEAPTLQTQLEILSANIIEKVTDIHDVIAYLQKQSSAEQQLLSQIITIMKLYYSNASNKCKQ